MQPTETNSIEIEDLTILSALKRVLETSRNHDAVAVGATEVSRALYRENSTRRFKLIVMAKDLHNEYQSIILSKAEELNIPVLMVETRKELGSILSFKVKNIGAVGVFDFINEDRDVTFIMKDY